MSEEVKNVLNENKKDINEEKQFSISINTGEKVFTLSGPDGSSFSEIETIAYKLLTEMVILKWKEAIRLEAEKNNSVKDDKTDESINEDDFDK